MDELISQQSMIDRFVKSILRISLLHDRKALYARLEKIGQDPKLIESEVFTREWLIFHTFILGNVFVSRGIDHKLIDFMCSHVYAEAKQIVELCSMEAYDKALSQRYVEYSEKLQSTKENPHLMVSKNACNNIFGARSGKFTTLLAITDIFTNTSLGLVRAIDHFREKGIMKF